MSPLTYSNLTHALAEQCAALEVLAFPQVDPADQLTLEAIHAYADTFPEGFFVCRDGNRVVGYGAGIFVDFDLDAFQHSIGEITGEHQCANHEPSAAWYYGTDVVVHPAYRRRGIGKRLYELRKDLVASNNKRGIVAGGYLAGFGEHKHRLSADQYVEEVRSGRLYDATLTFQLNNGFEILGAVRDYLRDDVTDGWAALIVWHNPKYVPESSTPGVDMSLVASSGRSDP